MCLQVRLLQEVELTGPGDLMWSMKKENRMTSLASQMVKNLPEMQETWVQSLCQEDPLEKGMATHSSILAWRFLWTLGPGGLGLQSMGLQRVRHD